VKGKGQRKEKKKPRYQGRKKFPILFYKKEKKIPIEETDNISQKER